MSIIGNLLDNAMEATLATTAPHYPVEVYIYDSEQELVIEVADQERGSIRRLPIGCLKWA